MGTTEKDAGKDMMDRFLNPERGVTPDIDLDLPPVDPNMKIKFSLVEKRKSKNVEVVDLDGQD